MHVEGIILWQLNLPRFLDWRTPSYVFTNQFRYPVVSIQFYQRLIRSLLLLHDVSPLPEQLLTLKRLLCRIFRPKIPDD